MFGIILIGVAASVVYKAAEMDNRNGTLWAAVSLLITLVSGRFLPFSYAIGLFGTLLLMLICNLVSDRRTG